MLAAQAPQAKPNTLPKSLTFAQDWRVCRSSRSNPSSIVNGPRAEVAAAAVRRLNERGIEGDIVEVGVFKGGLSCLMARTQLQNQGNSKLPLPRRDVWLFDTFEGMPAPTALDDRKSKYLYAEYRNGSTTFDERGCGLHDGKWCAGSLDVVNRTMSRSGYPRERIHFVQGKAEETLRRNGSDARLPRQIALLRLDTDFHASTEVELDVLWPLVTPGGWIFIDDYFDFGGCRRAVDTWLRSGANWRTNAIRSGAIDKQTRSFNVFKATSTRDPNYPFAGRQ